jgi:hypothetical protein
VVLQTVLSDFSLSLLRALSQLITGKLLTDSQIQSISSNLVGRFVADWLPEPKSQREAKQKVEKVRDYLAEATKIVSELKEEIDHRVTELESLVGEVEEKRKKVEEYTALIEAGEPAIRAIRGPLEESVRKELEAQAKKGRGTRLLVNLLAWLITLVLGAALGAHWSSVEGRLTGAGTSQGRGVQEGPSLRSGNQKMEIYRPTPASTGRPAAPSAR